MTTTVSSEESFSLLVAATVSLRSQQQSSAPPTIGQEERDDIHRWYLPLLISAHGEEDNSVTKKLTTNVSKNNSSFGVTYHQLWSSYQSCIQKLPAADSEREEGEEEEEEEGQISSDGDSERPQQDYLDWIHSTQLQCYFRAAAEALRCHCLEADIPSPPLSNTIFDATTATHKSSNDEERYVELCESCVWETLSDANSERGEIDGIKSPNDVRICIRLLGGKTTEKDNCCWYVPNDDWNKCRVELKRRAVEAFRATAMVAAVVQKNPVVAGSATAAGAVSASDANITKKRKSSEDNAPVGAEPAIALTIAKKVNEASQLKTTKNSKAIVGPDITQNSNVTITPSSKVSSSKDDKSGGIASIPNGNTSIKRQRLEKQRLQPKTVTAESKSIGDDNAAVPAEKTPETTTNKSSNSTKRKAIKPPSMGLRQPSKRSITATSATTSSAAAKETTKSSTSPATTAPVSSIKSRLKLKIQQEKLSQAMAQSTKTNITSTTASNNNSTNNNNNNSTVERKSLRLKSTTASAPTQLSSGSNNTKDDTSTVVTAKTNNSTSTTTNNNGGIQPPVKRSKKIQPPRKRGGDATPTGVGTSGARNSGGGRGGIGGRGKKWKKKLT
eukprot:CAMPEP_0194353434 /NCGR_PEP_ID=MMETSP0174-20130528/1752_1 /TAXON_ID=216777 /ORGANISM="Proboscia alata, Strain PI-D3" /LENGTH=613 /DNA_ID=CAMNT_0039121971 /DNA_START=169 /DNA_END=2010 /DNA_ORIENTATION=+